jgi:hypothetical protein
MVEIISKYDRSIVDKCCSISGYKKHVDDLDSDIEIIRSLQIDITKTNGRCRTLDSSQQLVDLTFVQVGPTEMPPPCLYRRRCIGEMQA